MQAKRLVRKVIGVATALVLALSLTGVASANYYGNVTHDGNIDGTYFFAETKALNSKWSSAASSQNRFILHTTWISSGNDWIEVGFVDGAMQEPGASVSYHHGFYTATGGYDSSGSVTNYSEYKITGPSTTTGTNHNYQVQRTGTSSWGVYVDYTLYRTYSNFATSCDRTDIGLETNYSGTTSAQWNERAFQVLQDGTWSAWPNGSILSEDSQVGISVDWDTSPTSIFTSKS